VMQRAMEWIAIRRLGPGAHSHVVLGRRMVHAHDEEVELVVDPNSSPAEPALAWWNKLSMFHVVRPLVVGIVHGLAGSAAVALLVLTTIGRPAWAIAYLLIFGLGTVAGMMLITAAIALPFAYTVQRFGQLNRGLVMASGFLSLAFGLFLCYQIGFVDGLFTGHANWVPR